MFSTLDEGQGINPRLTKGVVETPLTVFPGRSKTLKKVTKGT